MSKLSVSSIKSPPQTIVLAGENSPLIPETNRQISLHPNFQTVNCLNHHSLNHSLINISGIIYFIGFGGTSLNQTLFSTQTLFYFLRLAQANGCRFVLVIGEDSPTTTKTSLLLASQFVQIFKLKLDVIQTNSETVTADIVEAMIQKIIYRHKNIPIQSISPPRTRVPTSVLSKKQPRKNLIKLIAIFIGSILGLTLALSVYSTIQLNCGIAEFNRHNFAASQNCLLNFSNTSFLSLSGKIFPQQLDAAQTKNLISLAKMNQNYFRDLFVSQSSQSLSEISQLSQKINAGTEKNSPGENTSELRNYLRNLHSYTEKLIGLLPQIKKIKNRFPISVLLLFQDSLSTSPTGGKISGVGLLTVSASGVQDYKYYSGHTIDSLFPGQLSAPAFYLEGAGQSHLTLAELTHDPDRSKVMAAAANYVEKSLSQKVNLVVLLKDNYFAQIFPKSQASSLKSFLTNLNTQSTPQLSSFITHILSSLEIGQLHLQTTDPVIAEFGTTKWGGELQLTNCDSWLPCLHQLISPSFFLLDQEPLSVPLVANTRIDSVVSSTDLKSLLSINLPFLEKDHNFIFWFAAANQVRPSLVQLNGQPVSLLFQKNNYSPGVSLWGYKLHLSSDKNHTLTVDYVQDLPLGSDRFRYQFEFLSNLSLQGDLNVVVKYPPQWPAVSYLTPAVASAGELRYNVPLSSTTLILEYSQK